MVPGDYLYPAESTERDDKSTKLMYEHLLRLRPIAGLFDGLTERLKIWM